MSTAPFVPLNFLPLAVHLTIPMKTYDPPVSNRAISTWYLDQALDPSTLGTTINRCVQFVNRIDCDSIAFRGMSGALVAPAVSVRTGKSLLMVRKLSEKAHTSQLAEGNSASKRYVIIDDQVDSGETIAEILTGVRYLCGNAAECVGVLLYNYGTEWAGDRIIKNGHGINLPNLTGYGVIFSEEEQGAFTMSRWAEPAK